MTRELDREVAEKVMGWKQTHDPALRNGPQTWWDTGKRRPNSTIGPLEVLVRKDSFRPSEDIAAAFAVVERMREQHFTFWLHGNDDGEGWTACFYLGEGANDNPPQPEAEADGTTAPNVICRAALAALKVEA